MHPGEAVPVTLGEETDIVMVAHFVAKVSIRTLPFHQKDGD